MRHRVKGAKLNRPANERKRLFKNLTRSLILHGSIKTTVARAKAIQSYTEKMVTDAKVNSLKVRRDLLSEINDERTVNKLLTEIGPLFKTTNGGYTRIVKLITRPGDNSQMAAISFTKTVSKSENIKKERPVKTKKETKDNKNPVKIEAGNKDKKAK